MNGLSTKGCYTTDVFRFAHSNAIISLPEERTLAARNIIIVPSLIRVASIHVDSIFELLTLKEPSLYGIAIEDPPFQSIHSLYHISTNAEDIPRLEHTLKADNGLVNLTKTGMGVPTSRAM